MDAFPTFELQSLLDDLGEILETMEIPDNRKADYRWLRRNLAFRNLTHPDYDRATELLAILLRNEEL